MCRSRFGAISSRAPVRHFFSINREGSHVMIKRHRIQYGKDNQYLPTSSHLDLMVRSSKLRTHNNSLQVAIKVVEVGNRS
jgi:hypothetical protein